MTYDPNMKEGVRDFLPISADEEAKAIKEKSIKQLE